MANQVYANGREIACKAAGGKSIAAFPDTCLSPPSPPAGPLPIPYPNTAYANDTTNGSTTVMISGQEIMLKDQSTFKKSTGDEAATKSLGMGVVTHTIQGEASFIVWSMDVKIEGANVDRHLDQTIQNEQCNPPNTPPWTYVDRMAMANVSECSGEKQRATDACNPWDEKAKCPDNSAVKAATDKKDALKGKRGYSAAKAAWKRSYEDFAVTINKDKCHAALRCVMVPYKQGCCPGQTPDHAIDVGAFMRRSRKDATPIIGWANYDQNEAPCVCAEGPNQTTASHGQLSIRRGIQALRARLSGKQTWSRHSAAAAGAKAVVKTFPDSGCSQACLEAQINAYHDKARSTDPERPVKTAYSMSADETQRATAMKEMTQPPEPTR